eukprot:scaffold63842_cov36-Phaeocystis_antarctica.AAC.1
MAHTPVQENIIKTSSRVQVVPYSRVVQREIRKNEECGIDLLTDMALFMPVAMISVTNSRADCALAQQMVGCIKAISPCVKSASAKLFLDLHTVLAPSGKERARWRKLHRLNAQHGAAANVTGTRRQVVGVFLTWTWTWTWSWSQQPEGRACAASPALRGTLGRTPYAFSKPESKKTKNRTPSNVARCSG